MGLQEAAAVADVSPKVIRHCLAAAVVKPAQKAGHWRFSEDDALFFALRSAIPFDIDVADQRALYKVLVVGDTQAASWAGWTRLNEHTLELLKVPHQGTRSIGDQPSLRVVVEFKPIREALKRRLELLAKRRERIVYDPDLLSGEPVFTGTRVSVSGVGKLMLRGVPMAEMREDFPRLTDDDFELAKLLATIGPGPGRPRRRLPIRLVRESKRVG